MKFNDAIALRDQFIRLSVVSDQLKKNLKLQIPFCKMDLQDCSSETFNQKAIKMWEED
jgi:hypothetical protein